MIAAQFALHVRVRRALARRARLRLADGAVHFGRRVRFERMRPGAGEQFIEGRAERVDIARHPSGFPFNLFRRRVVGRHHRAHGQRAAAIRAGIFIDEPRDAEIEQLRLALRCDENVGGLQVAMHDQLAVRERHRRKDLLKNAQLRLDAHRRTRQRAAARPRRTPSPGTAHDRRSRLRRAAARCSDARAARGSAAPAGNGASRSRNRS